MISQKTVMVLGAGASNPYGLPLGWKLRELILELQWHSLQNCQFASPLVSRSDHFSAFKLAFRHTGALSIDSFLARSPHFMEVGKLAIAAVLLPHENVNRLLPASFHEDNWYGYLGQRMDAEPNRLAENQVSFVTFNYDRSLEMYLLTTWMNHHGLSEEEARSLVRKLDIVHVYGRLGSLWSDEPGFVPYGGGGQPESNIESAASGLRLIDDAERHEESDEFRRARELISGASHLCFLGFAFDKTNVQRLGGTSIQAGGFTGGQLRMCCATAYGMTEMERGRIAQLISHHQRPLHHPASLLNMRSLQALRESLILGY